MARLGAAQKGRMCAGSFHHRRFAQPVQARLARRGHAAQLAAPQALVRPAFESQLALLREHGEVRRPLRPLVQFSTPVLNPAGQPVAVLVMAEVLLALNWGSPFDWAHQPALTRTLYAVLPTGRHPHAPEEEMMRFVAKLEGRMLQALGPFGRTLK